MNQRKKKNKWARADQRISRNPRNQKRHLPTHWWRNFNQPEANVEADSTESGGAEEESGPGRRIPKHQRSNCKIVRAAFRGCLAHLAYILAQTQIQKTTFPTAFSECKHAVSSSRRELLCSRGKIQTTHGAICPFPPGHYHLPQLGIYGRERRKAPVTVELQPGKFGLHGKANSNEKQSTYPLHLCAVLLCLELLRPKEPGSGGV